MARARKVEQVELLADRLRRAKVAVLTDYRGLTVQQLQDLRGRLRTADVEYRIVKNTLARRAAEQAGVPDLQAELTGPTAIAFGYDDFAAPSRLLSEFVRATRLRLDVVGGLVDGRVVGADRARQLADLPPKDVLLAQLLGTLQSPVAQLVATIQAPVQQLVGLLESRRNQVEGAGGAA
jgi:large subunit ribosomal protein L10